MDLVQLGFARLKGAAAAVWALNGPARQCIFPRPECFGGLFEGVGDFANGRHVVSPCGHAQLSLIAGRRVLPEAASRHRTGGTPQNPMLSPLRRQWCLIAPALRWAYIRLPANCQKNAEQIGRQRTQERHAHDDQHPDCTARTKGEVALRRLQAEAEVE